MFCHYKRCRRSKEDWAVGEGTPHKQKQRFGPGLSKSQTKQIAYNYVPLLLLGDSNKLSSNLWFLFLYQCFCGSYHRSHGSYSRSRCRVFPTIKSNQRYFWNLIGNCYSFYSFSASHYKEWLGLCNFIFILLLLFYFNFILQRLFY